MSTGLFKTTIVIWSEFDGTALELEDLAREATTGAAYCSRFRSEFVKKEALKEDSDYDETEFFEDALEETDNG